MKSTYGLIGTIGSFISLKLPGMLGPMKHHRCRNAASSHALESLTMLVDGTHRLIVARSFLGLGFHVHHATKSTCNWIWTVDTVLLLNTNILTSFCIHFSPFHFSTPQVYVFHVFPPFPSVFHAPTTFGSLRRWPKRWV